MTTPEKEKLLREVFQAAARNQPAIDGPHPAENEELLLRWVEGDMTDQQCETILEHMANCSPCREEIAAMMRAGALSIPEVAEHEEGANRQTPTATLPMQTQPFPRRNLAWTVLAVAASLLLAAWIWGPTSLSTTDLLAQARRDLAAGNAESALMQVNDLLGQSLDSATNDQVQRFQKNLKIQTGRGIHSEYALDEHGAITDPAYNSLSIKSMVKDPSIARYEDEFNLALDAYPDDVPLLLNYGQFLLEQADYAKAREQFEKVLIVDNRNPRARLGLGLVTFHVGPGQSRSPTAEQRVYTEALSQFEMVLEVTSESVSAHINAAMCLGELDGREEEALQHWQRAAELTTDAVERAQLEDRIKDLKSPEDE